MTDLQFGASWSDSATWLGLIKIAAVNLLLSGDNALVMAMASHNLPSRKRRTAIVLGSTAYIVLMLAFTMSIAWLLRLPYLRALGGAMLCWIGIQSLRPDDPNPAAVFTGATFIGFIGGELALSDIVAQRWLEQASLDQIGAFFPLPAAAVVVALGRLPGGRPEGGRAASND